MATGEEKNRFPMVQKGTHENMQYEENILKTSHSVERFKAAALEGDWFLTYSESMALS